MSGSVDSTEAFLEPEQPANPGGRVAPEDDDEVVLDLYFAADQIVSIIKPVSLCMAVVVYIVRSVTLGNDGFNGVLVFNENDATSAGAKIGGAILNAAIILAFIVTMTIIFVCLYKYRCMKIIYGWLLLSTGLLLFVFAAFIGTLILDAYSVAVDWITMSLFLWNFAVVGLVSVFYRGPLKLQQGYLILVSALLASSLSRFPEWTTWALLGIVACYDIVAVLCPKGPLRILVEEAQNRPDEPLPGLLYSAGMAYMVGMATDGGSSKSGSASASGGANSSSSSSLDHVPSSRHEASGTEHATRNPLDEESGRGVKLGLGDFIFYSVLLARAAATHWDSTFVCFLSLLMGLILTLLLLGLLGHALPALPLSIALGIIFYFLTRYVTSPFLLTTSAAQIYF